MFQIRLHLDRISSSSTAGNEPARSKSAVHHRVSGVSMLELMTTLCRACYAKLTRTRFPIGDCSCRFTENRAHGTSQVPSVRPDKRGRENVDVSDRWSQLRNRRPLIPMKGLALLVASGLLFGSSAFSLAASHADENQETSVFQIGTFDRSSAEFGVENPKAPVVFDAGKFIRKRRTCWPSNPRHCGRDARQKFVCLFG